MKTLVFFRFYSRLAGVALLLAQMLMPLLPRLPGSSSISHTLLDRPSKAQRAGHSEQIRQASYPMAIDPLLTSQIAKLTASDGETSDNLGFSVSLSGDTLVVGAPHEDTLGSDAGAAYVFSRNRGGADLWHQVAKLTALDGAAGDAFGRSVAINGDRVVVGAYMNDDSGTSSGAAYIFERNQGGVDAWGQVKKLTASDGVMLDYFGYSIALSGDTLVVGAHGDDNSGSESGSVYIYARNDGGSDNWGLVRKVWATDGTAFDDFGRAIAISGDTLVVGAQGDDSDRGAAYVLERNQGGADLWGEVEKLVASDGAAGDNFGVSVAIHVDTVVVGADGNELYKGAAYVFERNRGGVDAWDEVKKLTAADGIANDMFGVSVAVDEDRVVVGASGRDDLGAASGAAYSYERNRDGLDMWGQALKVVAADGVADDQFGFSVAADGAAMVIGAYNDDDMGSDSGSAYLYQRTGGYWSQAAKSTSSDGEAADTFGFSVSVSGDTLAVGAFREDEQGNEAGAVYIFARNQGGADGWEQLKKITASDSAAVDHFGVSVSLSGDTLVVGAPYDDDLGVTSGSAYVFARNQGGMDNWGLVKKLLASDGAAWSGFGMSVSISTDTVVVGAYSDDHLANDAGAAYVFERNQGGMNNWGQVARLTASDGLAMDQFGDSVAISDDLLVVGAPYQDSVAGNAGAAYLFARNQGGVDHWGQIKKLTASDGAVADMFGFYVSIFVDTVVMSAPGDNSGAGSAYVFERNQGGENQCDQVAKLVASDGASSDGFGNSVSISGDTVVVGVYLDDSSKGAAYVFARNQGGVDHWGQERKLTALDGVAGDQFGCSVSIDGSVLSAGACYDEESGSDSGSVYVYRLVRYPVYMPIILN